MKTSPADAAFSKCVRARVDYTCEKCGAVHNPSSMGLHCSHIFSRRHRTIRWCGENAQALCARCHSWYGGSPVDSGKWVTDLIGVGALELIREKMSMRVKVPRSEEKQIAAHYRAELKKIQEKRATGIAGRIEFTSWQ